VLELALLDKLERGPPELAVGMAHLALVCTWPAPSLAFVAACPAATFALSSKPISPPSLASMSLLARANDPTPARLRRLRSGVAGGLSCRHVRHPG
jgi:hypothetical protein